MHFRKRRTGLVWDVSDGTGKEKRHLAVVEVDEKTLRASITPEEATGSELAEIEQALPRITNKLRRANLKDLIVCEGETEQRYLLEIADRLGISDKLVIVVADVHTPGKTLAKVGRDVLWGEATDEPLWSDAWLVFDRDSHADFHWAAEKCRCFRHVHMVFTNPCIEYWFLLHRQEFDPKQFGFDTTVVIRTESKKERLSPNTFSLVTHQIVEEITMPSTCLNELKALVPGYAKASEGRKYLRLFGKDMLYAYRRALELGSPEDGHGCDIPMLIDRLCELAGVQTVTFLESLQEEKSDKASGTAVVPKSEASVPESLPAVPAEAFSVLSATLASFLKAPELSDRTDEIARLRIELAAAADWTGKHIHEADGSVAEDTGASMEAKERLLLLAVTNSGATRGIFTNASKQLRCTLGSLIKTPESKMKPEAWQRFHDNVLLADGWLERRRMELSGESSV